MTEHESNTENENADVETDVAKVIVEFQSEIFHFPSRYVVWNDLHQGAGMVVQDKKDDEWLYRDEAGEYDTRDPEGNVLAYFQPHSAGVDLSRFVVRDGDVWWEDQEDDGTWDTRTKLGQRITTDTTNENSSK